MHAATLLAGQLIRGGDTTDKPDDAAAAFLHQLRTARRDRRRTERVLTGSDPVHSAGLHDCMDLPLRRADPEPAKRPEPERRLAGNQGRTGFWACDLRPPTGSPASRIGRSHYAHFRMSIRPAGRRPSKSAKNSCDNVVGSNANEASFAIAMSAFGLRARRRRARRRLATTRG